MAEAEEKLEVEGCGFLCVHEKVVEKVQHELPQEETLLRLADLFKVFGAKLLGMTQSAVSHQLRVLKQARLIKARRDGKTVFYSLADDHVATLLRQGMEHVCEGSGGECGE